MTDQEFEEMWKKTKEHDRIREHEWMGLPQEERDRITQDTNPRLWEDFSEVDLQVIPPKDNLNQM